MKNLLYILLIPVLIACKDDDPGPVNLNFTTSASDAVESAGLQTIAIQMSRAADQMIQLDFTVSGNAALNGDYKQITTTPLTIPVGTSSINIEIDLIDESIIEIVDKTLTFNLTNASTGVLSTTTGDLSHTFTIFDNDIIPSNGLQFDLVWDLGAGADINQVNLDLLLISNIVDSSGFIIDFEVYTADVGDNISGFETVLLNNNATDGEYFSAIFYTEGSSTVNYKLTVNGANFVTFEFTESFTTSDVGFAIIIGPFTKSGSTFSRVAGGTIGTSRFEIDASRFNSLLSPH